MSLEVFVSQDNNILCFIRISVFKYIIFQSLFGDRQFLISKPKEIEINSEDGVKSQSDSYRTDGLQLQEVGILIVIGII